MLVTLICQQDTTDPEITSQGLQGNTYVRLMLVNRTAIQHKIPIKHHLPIFYVAKSKTHCDYQ